MSSALQPRRRQTEDGVKAGPGKAAWLLGTALALCKAEQWHPHRTGSEGLILPHVITLKYSRKFPTFAASPQASHLSDSPSHGTRPVSSPRSHASILMETLSVLTHCVC